MSPVQRLRRSRELREARARGFQTALGVGDTPADDDRADDDRADEGDQPSEGARSSDAEFMQ